MPYKPGGGKKPQAYIPAGNGDESGEYTNSKKNAGQTQRVLNCCIKNSALKFNFQKSSLVQKVEKVYLYAQGVSMGKTGKPNSVCKKEINGYIVTERYYNSAGEVYLDIDYTCHGNPNTHPYVPHIHRWEKDETGKLVRGKSEVFK